MAQNNLGTVPVQITSPILTSGEVLFLQSLASNASYVSSNVVVMNSNNGGSPLQVLRVKPDGTGLEWASIAGGIGGSITTGQVAFATGANTIGGDSGLTWDNAAKKLITDALKIGTLSGVLKATTGDVSGGATTSDLPEGTNLYWTLSRFNTAFAGKTTDDLIEGTTNLYFTQTRARNALSANSPITYNPSTGVIGLDASGLVQNAGSTPSIQSGTDASKPAAGTAGRIYIATDTKKIYRDNGTSWVLITELISHINWNLQTGTSYTLQLSDDGGGVQMNNSSANTITIPNNSSVAFPIGTKIIVQKYGTGNTTIQGASGVTVDDPNSLATITVQKDARVIMKTDTNTWLIV
jgi:hypothetical protein